MAFFPIPKTKRYTIIKMAHFPVSFPLSSFMNQVLYETVLFSLVIPHLIIMPYFSFSTIQYLFIRASLCKYQSFKCEYLMNLNFHTPPKNWLINEKIGFKGEKFEGCYLVLFQIGTFGKAKQISSRMFVVEQQISQVFLLVIFRAEYVS